jgi:hypothetical protein
MRPRPGLRQTRHRVGSTGGPSKDDRVHTAQPVTVRSARPFRISRGGQRRRPNRRYRIWTPENTPGLRQRRRAMAHSAFQGRAGPRICEGPRRARVLSCRRPGRCCPGRRAASQTHQQASGGSGPSSGERKRRRRGGGRNPPTRCKIAFPSKTITRSERKSAEPGESPFPQRRSRCGACAGRAGHFPL